MVQAQHFDAGNLQDQFFQNWPRCLNQLSPDLLQQIASLLRLAIFDEMLLGCRQHTLQSHDEKSPTSIRTLGITCSMSRTGNCSVNAVAKRFCWSLKYEWANHRVSAEFESARQSVFNDLEIFYNERRRHQTRAWVSPGEFETDFHNRSSKAVETAQP